MATSPRIRITVLIAAASITMAACGSTDPDGDTQAQIDALEAQVEELQTTTTTAAPETTTTVAAEADATTTTTEAVAVVEPSPLAELGVNAVVTGPDGNDYGITQATRDQGSTIVTSQGDGPWVEAWQPEAEVFVRLSTLEVGPNGLIAVGSTRPAGDVYDVLEQREPLAVRSEDGATWAPAQINGDFAGRGGWLSDIAWSEPDNLYYAIGADGVSSQGQRALLFSSTDGVSWDPVDGPFDDQDVDEKGQVIIATDSGLAALGTAEYAVDPFAILWTYNAQDGWTRQDIAVGSASVFDVVDEFAACIETGSVDLATQTLEASCAS